MSEFDPVAYIDRIDEWYRMLHSHPTEVPDLPVGYKEEETDPRKPEQMKSESESKFTGDDLLRNVFGPEPRPDETEEMKKQKDFFFPNSKDSGSKYLSCQCGAASVGHKDPGPFHSKWCPLNRSW